MKVEGSIGIVFMLYASACHGYSFLINIHIEILVQLRGQHRDTKSTSSLPTLQAISPFR